MTFTLTTKRLHIRPIMKEDVHALVSLDSDPLVMKYISEGKPSTLADYEELLPRMMAYGSEPVGFFAAEFREREHRFIGWFHLRPSVVEPEILELGYRLERSSWGQGLATEGAMALLWHAFDSLGQEMVDACALPDNEASIAVMRKCGMQRVGAFMHPRGKMLCERYCVEASQFRQHVGPRGGHTLD